MAASARPTEDARRLNRLIDRCLQAPVPARFDAVLRAASVLEAPAVAERVRRRATVLGRAERQHRRAILTARDKLVLQLYRQAAPAGWYAAWCDGSVSGGLAGIGGLLLNPRGNRVGELSRAIGACDPFGTELAAACAVLRMALGRGAQQVCAYTDCDALVALWMRQRDDPRLRELCALVRECRRFELRRIPRQHNQPAHRLARRAIDESTTPAVCLDSPVSEQ